VRGKLREYTVVIKGMVFLIFFQYNQVKGAGFQPNATFRTHMCTARLKQLRGLWHSADNLRAEPLSLWHS
jgi:hypothetical protein